MKEIKLENKDLVLCRRRPDLEGGCEYIILEGKNKDKSEVIQ